MPRLTIRQHHFFSPETTHQLDARLTAPGHWDTLRASSDHSSFTIPLKRNDWRERCSDSALTSRGADVAALAGQLGVSGILSFGVGTGCIEYNIHRADPELALHLSDYSPETVRRLRLVFPEADSIEVLDLLSDDVPYVRGTLTMLHRIDTEFTDQQFRGLFMTLHARGHQWVLLIPTIFLTARELGAELARRVVSRLRQRQATWTGYVRTRPVFEEFWADLYRPVRTGRVGEAEYILLDRLA